MTTLNIGCNFQYLEGAVNVDINPKVNPDKIVDLEGKLPFKDNTFDKVIGIEIMEHIKNTHNLMQELRRVLKPKGKIELTVPYHGFLKNIFICFVNWGLHFNPTGEHLRFYNEQSFRYIFRHNGFKVDKFNINGRFKSLANTMSIEGTSCKRD